MKIINMVSGIYKLFLSEFVEVAFFFFFLITEECGFNISVSIPQSPGQEIKNKKKKFQT